MRASLCWLHLYLLAVHLGDLAEEVVEGALLRVRGDAVLLMVGEGDSAPSAWGEVALRDVLSSVVVDRFQA